MGAEAPPQATVATVAIIGAGFAGTSAAVQLLRASRSPLRILLVDPAHTPGPGLAYGTVDPDHRLNAPIFVHSLLADDITHFSRWYRARGLLATDPAALEDDGCVYPRRADFGRYLSETVQACIGGAPGDGLDGALGGSTDAADWRGHPGSTAEHRRARALAIQRAAAGGWQITTDHGPLDADTVVLATGAAPAAMPSPLDGAGLQGHPALQPNPWSADLPRQLAALPGQARVMVLGSGLTALDLISTLLRERPDARIDVLSRRGLRPRPQGPWPAALQQLLAAQPGIDAACALPPGLMLSRLQAEPPEFLRSAPATARGWLRALRVAAGEAEAAGQSWHGPFDALRDSLSRSWPALPGRERRRLLQRVRPWFDVLRYRSPPANQRLVAAAETLGQLRFRRGRLLQAQADGAALQIRWQAVDPAAQAAVFQVIDWRADLVINCTGTPAPTDPKTQPLMANALEQGLLQRDASGLGVAVDRLACALAADGRPQSDLRVIGQPTLGASGDAVGAIFIAAQAARMVAHLVGQPGR